MNLASLPKISTSSKRIRVDANGNQRTKKCGLDTLYITRCKRSHANAIEESLTYNMDFTTMAKTLESMQPNFVAKLLHYMNPTYSTELELVITRSSMIQLKRKKEKYDEFLRKNTSMAQVYNKMDKALAAAKLEESTEFNLDDSGLIFSKMDYFQSSRNSK